MRTYPLEHFCRIFTLLLGVATLASGIYLESGVLLLIFGAATAAHLPLLVRDAVRSATARA